MPRITVVIPTLNEEASLGDTLGCVYSHASVRPEVVVADGGSHDGTCAIARRRGARVVCTNGGRAKQLNLGARSGACETILFLHADTCPPVHYDREIERVLTVPRTSVGAFRLRIGQAPVGLMRIVQTVANLRARVLCTPYGDQGLFVRRNVFESVGGYPDMPFLDDYEMVRRLRRNGRVRIAQSAVRTSSRRWDVLGVVPTTVINQCIIVAYHLGIPVPTLRNWYRGALVRALHKRQKGNV